VPAGRLAVDADRLIPMDGALLAARRRMMFNGVVMASLAVDGYTMPFAGEIVGVSFVLSAAAAAGVGTVGATIGGTEDADTTLTMGTSAGTYKRVKRGSARFVAGDKIGCELTTDGSWDATTSDLGVTVWVLLEMEGI
jgi:ribonuclease J